MASCCAQSLVPACRKRHCGVQQVNMVFFLRIKSKGKVKSHFYTILEVIVLAKRCKATGPEFYFWGKLPATATGKCAHSLRPCLQQARSGKVEIEVRETLMNAIARLDGFRPADCYNGGLTVLSCNATRGNSGNSTYSHHSQFLHKLEQ